MKEAQAFVEFVLRHTWPERAKRHGPKVVHELIVHHPFAKLHMTPETIAQIYAKPAPTEDSETLLRDAASKFRYYQSQHEAKGRAIELEIAECDEGSEQDVHLHQRLHDTATKAQVNARLAERIEKYLAE